MRGRIRHARGDEPPAPVEPSRLWGFVSARYSTGTSGFLFGGYGYGPGFAMVGMVNNPRSGYTEFLGGVGARFNLGTRTSHAVALAASRATESWYAQLYYLPTVTLGPVTAEATVQVYHPMSSAGAKQFAVNPMSIQYAFGHWPSAGASYQLALQEGDGPVHAAGPAVRLAVPGGAITLDLLRGLRDFNDEVRVSFRAFY